MICMLHTYSIAIIYAYDHGDCLHGAYDVYVHDDDGNRGDDL